MTAVSQWEPPQSSYRYLSYIRRVERDHDMPKLLLVRLLYQESRFREDIITGETVSSAGAVGIAQIVPRWHVGVDPLDPYESIEYAGAYLFSLYQKFGEWRKALAAYNWGQGNLRETLKHYGPNWLQHLPDETFRYVTEITADVPVGG